MWYVCDDNGIRREFDNEEDAIAYLNKLLDRGEEDVWISAD